MARENSRSAGASRVRTGMCINDGCEKARSKEKQEIRSGHDFVCSECGSELRECAPVKKKNNKLPLIIAATVVVLGGGTAALFMGGGEEETTVVPEVAIEPDVVNVTLVDTEDSETEPEGEDTASPVTDGMVTKDLGYAVYKGIVKNGKMNDNNGVLTFKQKHIIEPRDVKKRMAEPGEKVVGIFEDGHLTTGTWYKKDGNKETIIP